MSLLVVLLMSCSPERAHTGGQTAARGRVDTTSETLLLASDGGASDFFGVSLAGAGDLNGDGHADLIIGASGDDDLGSSAGAAYAYYGTVSGIHASSED